ncbi:uncharacterized protein LOC109789265 [Cajanus cajan]|uniref:uncharacterized protein LOC109789265 n=1 Tax=Cajanus cajan TaxID=3821 RepID=UPI00098DAF72|nr:uncharacterized protein LOC109789265 [Cajanus cajan]
MRLNPEKCVFGVQGGKFLKFMITHRGIEANLEKCKAIIQIHSPHNVKDVQRLAGRLLSLSRFIPRFAEKARPIFTLLRKPKNFEWTDQCEEAFKSFKTFLTTPPVLQRPHHHSDLLLYLAVGGGAGIILEGPNKVTIEQSLKFGFRVTNNQAEYEVLLAGLRLAHDLGAQRVSCNSDSKLMVEQLSGAYQTKDTLLQRYFHAASQQISSFDEFTIRHVPREQNVRADLLSKLASTKRPGQHRTIIQETLNSPSLDDKVVIANKNEDQGWMTGIWSYLKEGTLPEDKDEAQKMRVRSSKFVIIGDELFKRSISTPLLKCLAKSQATYVIEEIHRGICGMHSGARSMATRVLRAGYYVAFRLVGNGHPQTISPLERSTEIPPCGSRLLHQMD